MEFSAEAVADLRRRLGWSQADLARRLGCQMQDVETWESGDAAIPDAAREQLRYLHHQSGGLAESVVLEPLAQVILAKTQRTQVHRDEVDGLLDQDDLS